MSEHSNDTSRQLTRRVPSELPAKADLVQIDCSGLARTLDLLSTGHLTGESAVALLRHELGTVQRQAQSVGALLQQATVQLRQLRESAQREQIQKQDEQRQLQDQNDRFVANLIQEHDQEMVVLRRERDAAIDRIRELSRDLSRASSASSAGIPHLPVRSAPPLQVAAELNARIDELLRERERSLRLLRQLAEQRDAAESRLQSLLASIGSYNGANSATMLEGSQGIPSVEPAEPYRAAHSPRPHDEPLATAEVLKGDITPSLDARREQSDEACTPAIDDPEGWDADAESNAPGPDTSPRGTDPTSGVESAAPPLPANDPSLARWVKGSDHSGAYSMQGSELSRDEVFVPRGTRVRPKSTQ